ncbi:MAG: hypothetical protein U0Q19_19335 [Kineosporiaceae bacterium]
MIWWAWLIVFVLIALGGGWVLFVQARSVWRKAMALFDELSTASAQLEVVTDQLDQLEAAQAARGAAASTASAVPAVFDSPQRLRQERVSRARRR